MPFIRYQNGDLVEIETSQGFVCGSIFQRIKRIVGRETDLIKTEQGGYYSIPAFLASIIIQSIENIRQYQVAVLRDGTIELRLVTENALSSKERALLRGYLKEYLGKETQLQIKRVASILPDTSGKGNLVVRD